MKYEYETGNVKGKPMEQQGYVQAYQNLGSATNTNIAYSERDRPISVPAPESVTTITSECLAALHEINQRLRRLADRIGGPVPAAVDKQMKSPGEPSLIDTLRYVRGAIGEAHDEISRIERGI